MRNWMILMRAAVIVTMLTVANSARAQTIFPPSSTQNLTVTCVNEFGQTVPNCDVRIATGYYQFSNGHFHDSPGHPWSSVSPTSGNTGCCGLPVTLTTTIVGQEEAITACADFCNTANYAVGFGDLGFVAENQLWVLVGGNTTNHGDNNFNHWGTASLSNGIFGTASDFLQLHPEVGRIGLNDIALPIGGKFDLNNDWTSPHAEHDRGTAVDVNFVPTANAQEFVDLCLTHGAAFAQVESNPYHIHCRW